jgi:GDP-mannose 4,6 dehydratase
MVRSRVAGGAGFIVDRGCLRGGGTRGDRDRRPLHGQSANVPSAAKFFHADIRAPAVAEIFREERPQVLSHHPAQLDVRRSVADPGFDADLIVLGTLDLLEAARSVGVSRVSSRRRAARCTARRRCSPRRSRTRTTRCPRTESPSPRVSSTWRSVTPCTACPTLRRVIRTSILEPGGCQAKGLIENGGRYLRSTFEPGRAFANELLASWQSRTSCLGRPQSL